VNHCPAALLPGLSVAAPVPALKIIPCISRVPFGALSAIWPPSICSVDQWNVSGQCARVRIRRSWSSSCPALAPVSGLVRSVREKVVRDLCLVPWPQRGSHPYLRTGSGRADAEGRIG
jgi:hypothetical protein